MTQTSDALIPILRLLRQQRTALTLGDKAALATAARRLERALSLLPRPLAERDLKVLRREAGDVAELVRAAQSGLERARALIARRTAPAQAAAGLTTYDASGRRNGLAPAPGRTLARG